MTIRQSLGYSVIEVIVVVFVLLAAGAGGWYVWQDSQKNASTRQSESTGHTSKPTRQTNKEQVAGPADPSEGGKYLVIREWGVRIPLPGELRGDVYYKLATNDLTKLQRASFASNKLDTLLGDYSCSFRENSQNDGLSSGLLRINPDDKQQAPDYVIEDLNVLKAVGQYEYFTSKQKETRITCLTGRHEEFNSVERSISNQLREAFRSLEAVY
jgi:hypothetical protein